MRTAELVGPASRSPPVPHPSVHLSTRPSPIRLSVHTPTRYLPTHLSPTDAHTPTPSTSLPIHLSVHLCVHPSVYPPVHPLFLPSFHPPVLPMSVGPPQCIVGAQLSRGTVHQGVPGRVRQGGVRGPVGVPRALRRLRVDSGRPAQRQWGPCTAEGGRGYGLGTQGEGRGPDEGAWLWGAGRGWARLHRRTPSWARPLHRHPCWGALARGPPAPRAPHGRKRGAGLAVMAACGGARPASSAFVKVQAVGWG